MNDFRNLSRRAQQKAIDGIVNGQSRQIQFGDKRSNAFAGRSAAERMRAGARRVDSFGRPNGFHATPRPGQSAPNARPTPTSTKNTEALLQSIAPKPPKEKELSKRARKSKIRREHRVRRWALRSGLAMVCLVLLMGGLLFAKGYIKLHKVFKGTGTAAALRANVSPSLLRGEGDGRINILLMGKGGPGHDGPDLTDTMLLASVDPINKKMSLVSVPRDLWVTVPGYGSSKINSVYANAKYHAQSVNPKDKAGAEKAGVTQVEKTVSQVLGVPIHYYGMVDFQAFEQAVDTVGGVDMDVPANDTVTEMLWDESTHHNYYLNVGQGKQHFNGQRALFFSRSRHTSPRGDFDRTERQRLLIEALSSKVASAGTYTNPVKVSQLMSAFGDHVATDMSIGDGVRLMKLTKGGKFDSIDLASADKPLVTTGMVAGQSIVQPSAGIADYSEINSFIRNKLRDGYLAKENANVTVLNGTDTAGLASKKADELKSYGYNVGTVADAPTHSYQHTVIVDLTNGKDKYTQNYLEKRFKLKVVHKLPDTSVQPGTANFVIILGQDAQ
jgi:polyisoprenyl-teichoic acid--peptidoglycan teichoic acid transferase